MRPEREILQVALFLRLLELMENKETVYNKVPGTKGFIDLLVVNPGRERRRRRSSRGMIENGRTKRRKIY